MNLQEFLEIVPKIEETDRYKELALLKKYFDGEQYKQRKLDVSGMIKGTTMAGSVSCSPNWKDRDPGAVWNIRREIVEEITDWSMVGDAWPEINVTGDRDATDWLLEAIKQSQMREAVAKARNYGGAQRCAITSLAIFDGEPFFEAHEPIGMWVLEWQNRQRWRPSLVAKVFKQKQPVTFENAAEREVLRVRVWSTTQEQYYTRVKLPSGQYAWQLDQSVTHGLGMCPVWWYPQFADAGDHDGIEDAPNTLDLVDDANYLAGAASANTRRNADDILVIREDPSLNHGKVRKAATNAIFARGGAEYLTQDGASSRICEEISDRRAQRVYRAAGVVILSNEEVGRMTSAEMIKKIMHRMIKRVSRVRSNYERFLIVPMCKDLLTIGRKLRGGIVLPPIVEHDEKLEIDTVRPRNPGKSSVISVAWPDPFPPTFQDKQLAVAAATTGTGNKPVLQQKSAIKLIQSAGIELASASPEEELEGIQDDESHKADMQAKAFGDMPTGKAGPIGGMPKNEPEEDDDSEEQAPSSRPLWRSFQSLSWCQFPRMTREARRNSFWTRTGPK